MKTLILCRHAKSDWPGNLPDLHRPLKRRGVEDANYLGEILGSQGFRPDRIITSPALRARQTSEIVSACISFPGTILEERIVYYEDENALVELIQRQPDTLDTVMIFGHNPTMEDTVRQLLGSKAPFQLPTCAMVCLESMARSWQYFRTENLHLRWQLIPRLKRKTEY